jgi:4a-hydroxytetrahydrobiopterin dehydratase
MAAPPKLSDEDVNRRTAELDGWAVVDSALQRAFEFPSFAEAFGFMAVVALHAQRMDHHPDWSNVYNRVDVRLSSHDVGGISERDFKLAAKIDDAYRAAT